MLSRGDVILMTFVTRRSGSVKVTVEVVVSSEMTSSL